MPRDHAIVIGGSVAGCLAARVLSDHFERVTVVERDALPEQAEQRAGTPHARHFHILLASGREAMGQLLPGMAEDMRSLGVPEIDMGADGGYYTPSGWTKRFQSGIVSSAVSRITLEWYIRSRVRERSNVCFLMPADAKGLRWSPDGSAVVGLAIERKRNGELEDLEADLVVDTAGRTVEGSGYGSKTPQWLVQMGYEEPEESVVDARLGYSSRWYEAPTDPGPDWRYLVFLPQPGFPRGGGILTVEGGRWTVTLAGTNGDYPPADEDGFLDFARSFPSPEMYDAITGAKPVSPVYSHRRTENRRRHYERMGRRPERLLVMGDAYCGFNPIYGQGMTVAALEALKLDSLLRAKADERTGFPGRFFSELAGVVKTPWQMATGEDLRYPDTEGIRPGGAARLLQLYSDRIGQLMPHDETIARAFLGVANLVNPPTVLFRPGIVGRVLWHSLVGQGVVSKPS